MPYNNILVGTYTIVGLAVEPLKALRIAFNVYINIKLGIKSYLGT